MGRLEERAEKKFVKFSKRNCEVWHLGRNDLNHHRSLRGFFGGAQ